MSGPNLKDGAQNGRLHGGYHYWSVWVKKSSFQPSCYLKPFNLKMSTPYLLHLSLNNKVYFELPTTKRFLNKVKKGDDDLHYFQDVIMKDFENAKERKKVERKLNGWRWFLKLSTLDWNLMMLPLQSMPFQSLIKDIEFCDEALICLLEFYEKPLKSAGFDLKAVSPNCWNNGMT